MRTNFIKHVLLTFTLIMLSSLTSCNNEDDEIVSNDNYYVKYIIRGNGTYGRFSNWSASTPQGNYTNNDIQVRSWNQTFGPVNRGFRCNIQIGNYISGAPLIEIHVSKNQETFALKASRTGNSATYTIDF